MLFYAVYRVFFKAKVGINCQVMKIKVGKKEFCNNWEKPKKTEIGKKIPQNHSILTSDLRVIGSSVFSKTLKKKNHLKSEYFDKIIERQQLSNFAIRFYRN